MDPLLLAAVGGIIAGILGAIRTYLPGLPNKYSPLIVIGIAALFFFIGINSGEIEGGFTVRTIIDVINQALVALGFGRGVTAVAGKTDEGVPRLAAAAATLPGAPLPTPPNP